MSDATEVPLDGITVRTARYEPGATMRPHEHETGSITFVYRGGLVEQTVKGEESAAPLSVVVKPPGVRHSNRFGPAGASVLRIVLSPALVDSWRPEWELGPWRWIHGGEFASEFLALLASLRDGPPHRGEIQSQAIDLLASARLNPDPGRSGPVPPWLGNVRDRIRGDFAEGVRVQALAGDVGVHPVSLARAFRRHYGTSITSCVRRIRVREAAARLSGTDEPLAGLAQMAGFADQAHMCRVFKTTTGLTPGRYRELSRQ